LRSHVGNAERALIDAKQEGSAVQGFQRADRQTRNEKYAGIQANLRIVQVSLNTYPAFLDGAG